LIFIPGGGRGGRKGREEESSDFGSRPSGPSTLFDFLNDKIPEPKGKLGLKSDNEQL